MMFTKGPLEIYAHVLIGPLVVHSGEPRLWCSRYRSQGAPFEAFGGLKVGFGKPGVTPRAIEMQGFLLGNGGHASFFHETLHIGVVASRVKRTRLSAFVVETQRLGCMIVLGTCCILEVSPRNSARVCLGAWRLTIAGPKSRNNSKVHRGKAEKLLV